MAAIATLLHIQPLRSSCLTHVRMCMWQRPQAQVLATEGGLLSSPLYPERACKLGEYKVVFLLVVDGKHVGPALRTKSL